MLLLNPHTVRQRALWLSKALTLPAEVVSWLVCCHPSYLVAEPGAVGRWRDDVQHLLQLSYKQVHKLVACPEVRGWGVGGKESGVKGVEVHGMV